MKTANTETKTITVVCRECGKLQDVEPELVDRLKKTSFRIRCDECGSLGLLSQMIEEGEEEKKMRPRNMENSS